MSERSLRSLSAGSLLHGHRGCYSDELKSPMWGTPCTRVCVALLYGRDVRCVQAHIRSWKCGQEVSCER